MDGWVATKALTPKPGKSGGNFSVGYEAERVDAHGTATGEIGFVKAIDYSKWRAFGPDPLSALPVMTEAFQFELNIVLLCSGKRMKNVVKGITHGSIDIGAGLLPTVNYIIFEVADCDIREHLDALAVFDSAWAFRSLHNISKGLQQLHLSGVFHQDIKPSNVLTFTGVPESEQTKLGDLGRASRTGHSAPHDGLTIPGDPVYATPESFYGFRQPDDILNRLASDTYHLGSMVNFLFTKLGMSAALFGRLDPRFRPPMLGGTWGGTYEQVLPHLRVEFDASVTHLRSSISAEIDELADDLMRTVRQLCDPDPRLRGLPGDYSNAVRRYSMERYVSEFDRFSRRANIALKKAIS